MEKVELSLYVKNASREKFISRVATDLCVAGNLVSRDLLRDVALEWMRKNHRDIENPEASRIAVSFEDDGRAIKLSAHSTKAIHRGWALSRPTLARFAQQRRRVLGHALGASPGMALVACRSWLLAWQRGEVSSGSWSPRTRPSSTF